MKHCPTCGRRHRASRSVRPDAPLPLFEWMPPALPRVVVPLVMVDGCPDAEGQPRPALLIPGSRIPRLFVNLAAALAAKNAMEAAHVGR